MKPVWAVTGRGEARECRACLHWLPQLTALAGNPDGEIQWWDKLPAKFPDSVDLKDGFLNYRVCTVKFLVVEFLM